MKKIIAIALFAIMMAACTYKSSFVSNKTPVNLANLNLELINYTATAAVLTLLDLDMQNKDTILTAGFDTLLSAETYYNRFGSKACEMDIQLIADSTWSFSSTGAGMISVLGTLHMTGRNTDKYATFNADYNGMYDESNGFSADFSSSKLEYSLQPGYAYVEGYGYVSQLKLYCYGDALLKTYLNTVPLDNVTTTFKGDEISY